ncbi:MAG: GldM family protein [Bacteroidetes bacterium]|nr:GldM family protein [Bacteroidota bacterium]
MNITDGFGNYASMGNSVGEHTWKGVVRIPHPNPKRKGEFLTYPFENKYLVAQPSAVVSSDKLNIMYMKLANEMTISVPGISSDKIRVSNSKCSISKKGNGQFVFTPNAIGKTDIVVQAEISPGKWETMGTYQWMIKKLPKPEIILGNKEVGGKINKSEILAIGKIKAKYSDDFPLSATPSIQSCKVQFVRGSDLGPQTDAPGGVFNPTQINSIRALRKNESVSLEIVVRGADGITYTINRTMTIL